MEYALPTSPFVFDPKKEFWDDFVKRHKLAYEDERSTDRPSDDGINESYGDLCRSLRIAYVFAFTMWTHRFYMPI
jgi:hypothetical protein